MNSPSGNKTVRDLIQVTSEYLEGKGVESARLNTERLLADGGEEILSEIRTA